MSQASGAETQVRAERIQTELDALSFQDSTFGRQIDQFQLAVARAKEEQTRMLTEEQNLWLSVDANRRNLCTMEGRCSDRLLRFGEHMPALLAAIDDAHRKGQFKKKPLGPLGYLFRLKDPELALAVETCLNGLMVAFTCDNHEDERVLQGLMSSYPAGRRRNNIITSQFLPNQQDTSGREVYHPDYPSVLQALEIEDPVVANCLIDQRSIETVLLIKNRAEACKVMHVMQSRPRNCSKAFSKDGDRITNNRFDSSEQRRASYLRDVRDVEEEISARHLWGEIENQVAHIDRFKQQMKWVDEDVRQNQGLLKRAYDDRKKAKDKFRRLEMEMSDLQKVEEPQSEDLSGGPRVSD